MAADIFVFPRSLVFSEYSSSCWAHRKDVAEPECGKEGLISSGTFEPPSEERMPSGFPDPNPARS